MLETSLWKKTNLATISLLKTQDAYNVKTIKTQINGTECYYKTCISVYFLTGEFNQLVTLKQTVYIIWATYTDLCTWVTEHVDWIYDNSLQHSWHVTQTVCVHADNL